LLSAEVQYIVAAMKLGPDPVTALSLSPLEATVLAAAGRQLGMAGEAWRAQCARLTVLSRSHSGVGFVTRLDVAAEAPVLPADVGRRLGPVHATHPALGEPVEFQLQLKAGRVSTIEAFSPAGMWPADERGFRVVDGP
jgi:hypothetical protein